MIRKRRKNLRDKEVESETISNEANRKKVTFFLPATTNKELPAGRSYLRTYTHTHPTLAELFCSKWSSNPHGQRANL
jgi:hypothetical protein